MDSIKIQLNSLEALEKLISGDEKLEFEIKNSVIQSFVTKHLKGIANEETVKNAEIAIRKELDSTFFTRSYSNYTLKQEYASEIRKNVDWKIREVAIEYANSESGIEKLRTEIHNKLQSISRSIEEEFASQEIERRLNLMVEKRIKERLGLK